MLCKICSVRLQTSESYYVCPKCGRCSQLPFVEENYDIFLNHSITNPIQYIRKDYFIRILSKHDLTNAEFRNVLTLFDKYNAAFIYLNIRKNMLSTKFIINKFCSMIGKKEPYKKPLKCKSSYIKVSTIWKKICIFNRWIRRDYSGPSLSWV